MKRLIFLLVLIFPCVCFGDAGLMVLVGQGVSGGCTATACGAGTPPDLACDTHEGSADETWSESGNPVWSYAGSGRGSCSDDYWIATNPVPGDYQTHDFTDDVTNYTDFWFKFANGPDDDTDKIDLISIQTDGGLGCITISMTNNSSVLELSATINGGSPSATVTVVAGTWYHIGTYFDSTANEGAWYVSTEDDLGAAEESLSSLSTSRVPGHIRIGNIGDVGTFDITMNYDSIGIDNDAFTAVEY